MERERESPSHRDSRRVFAGGVERRGVHMGKTKCWMGTRGIHSKRQTQERRNNNLSVVRYIRT